MQELKRIRRTVTIHADQDRRVQDIVLVHDPAQRHPFAIALTSPDRPVRDIHLKVLLSYDELKQLACASETIPVPQNLPPPTNKPFSTAISKKIPMPSDTIDRFSGEYRWLSNFWLVPIDYNGHIYHSTEHAFQATKAANEKDREQVANSKTPGDAKRRGRQVKIRSDWEEVKLNIMRELLRAKFTTGSNLAQKLIATGNVKLVEGNHWGDTFWGIDDRRGGENWLGVLLMQRRHELISGIQRSPNG